MKNNRLNCKSLTELHLAISKKNIKFPSLTIAEVNTLTSVFGMNAVTEDEFTRICEAAQKAAMESAVNEIKIKGGNTMNIINNAASDEAIANAINAAISSISKAKDSVKVNAGMDAEEFKTQADESINVIKDATCSVLEKLDHLVGATTLKKTLYSILYRNLNDRSSKRGFFDAARECRAVIANHINVIMAFDPSEDEFKTVVALRYMIGENENGEPIVGHRSIFTAFAQGIVWVCKKVSRKLRSWFGVDAESNIFGSVGASIASILGIATGIITNVIKVVASAIIFVGSYAVSAILNAVSFVWDNLKKAGSFVKGKLTKKDEEEDATDEAVIKAEDETETC